jgi:hypothetical protein
VGVGAEGETGNLAVGTQVLKPYRSVGEAPASLPPVRQGRLVARVAEVGRRAETGLAADAGLDRAAFGRAAASPVPAVLVAEDPGEVGGCALCLLHHRHGHRGDEELRTQLWILWSEPGTDADVHHDLR